MVGHAKQSGQEDALRAEQDDEVTEGLGTQKSEQLTHAQVFNALATAPASESAKEVSYARPNDDRDAPPAEPTAAPSHNVGTQTAELSTEAKVAKVQKAMMDDLIEYGSLRTAGYYAKLVGWGRTAVYHHEPIAKLLRSRRLSKRDLLKGSKIDGRIECEWRRSG